MSDTTIQMKIYIDHPTVDEKNVRYISMRAAV